MVIFSDFKNDNFDILKQLIITKNDILSYASYGIINKETDSMKCFFSHKDWQKVYQKNCYWDDDPLFRFAVDKKAGDIPWGLVPKETKKSRMIMEERNEICSIQSGITFYLNTKKRFHIMAIGSSLTEDLFLYELSDCFVNLFKSVMKQL